MNFIPVNTERKTEKIGGKAYNLSLLDEIGVNVPEWTVISSELFFDFIGEKKAEYEKLLSDYNEESRISILDIINNGGFSDNSITHIRNGISELFSEDTPVSVRSSATDEDGENYSFAGMLESYLNVTGFENILEAIKNCYLSCFSERIMEYRAKGGLIKPDISVAVIIQRMVDAEISGVMFTTEPTTNNPDEILISAVNGLGEGLVSGEKNSSDYIVDYEGKTVSRKESEAILSDGLLSELYDTAIKIEKSFSPRRSLDIEFSVRDKRIFILQSRPITTYSHIDKNVTRTILDNSNIIESYSGVTSPLTFTFAREVYSKIYRQTLRSFYVSEEAINMISDDLDNMLNFFENKIYYRLNSWYRMTSLYPGYQKNAKYMENMMGVKTTLNESPVGAKTRLVRIYSSFIVKLMRMKKDSKRFLERFNSVTEPYYANDFEGMTNEEVLGIYDTLEREILDDFITPIANDMGAMIFYGMLTDNVKKKAPENYEGLISAVISRQGNVESAEQSASLLRIVEEIRKDEELIKLFEGSNTAITEKLGSDEPVFRMINEYIFRYGARTMDELKLETVTLFEDPLFLFDMIRGYLSCDTLPEYGAEWDNNAEKELVSRFFVLKRPYIKLLLKITKFFIRNRESLRLRRTYIYSVVRNIYLRIGKNFEKDGLIESCRDIFFLEKSEISDIVKNGGNAETIRDNIERRKAEYDENKTKTIYERMYFYGGMDRKNMLPIYSRQEVSGDGILRGVAGGGKVITGTVKLVEDPADADVQGYILMAKRTDPGWTVLFPMAKAIIIERGSILSHSAVVAREMGITLVAGVRGLTDKVKDGMRVRVDGVNGTVEILGNDDE